MALHIGVQIVPKFTNRIKPWISLLANKALDIIAGHTVCQV
uniref:Uncharacterized protein n=1 Tax=Arundo donax TaxID=35708 RepID=A0A0A9BE75_ARUDO